MSPAPAPKAAGREKESPVFDFNAFVAKNPWVFILLAFLGGNGTGTTVIPKVFAFGGVTTEEVQRVVDKSIAENNHVLLQQIELLLAREKLRSAGLSSPVLAGQPEP